jgi:hypothetical protein
MSLEALAFFAISIVSRIAGTLRIVTSDTTRLVAEKRTARQRSPVTKVSY